jgi:hypothetical protein
MSHKTLILLLVVETGILSVMPEHIPTAYNHVEDWNFHIQNKLPERSVLWLAGSPAAVAVNTGDFRQVA